ncbi:hypothetical protein [Zwartia vadi]|uniref:hypothetical protein n=1 Tax=Zwartia vadi TaxID=3058168 RepID=UPI0025B3BE5C|nr:hypothetical protein [Zwartia vadi]MDN3986803.1 hypothetical protein [Zwartia vadi]
MAIMLTQRIPAQLQDNIPEPSQVLPVLELTLADRQRSRLAAMLPNGRAVAVILPRGESMQHGDVLCGESGERILIQAAAEELLLIRAENAFELMRIVYHLANRHVRAMLQPEAVLIEPDPVLAGLIVRLGGTVEKTLQPFLPEGGAYSGTPGHHHHAHPSECGLEGQDEAMGQVGEQLSIQAHAKSKT